MWYNHVEGDSSYCAHPTLLPQALNCLVTGPILKDILPTKWQPARLTSMTTEITTRLLQRGARLICQDDTSAFLASIAVHRRVASRKSCATPALCPARRIAYRHKFERKICDISMRHGTQSSAGPSIRLPEYKVRSDRRCPFAAAQRPLQSLSQEATFAQSTRLLAET